MSLFTDLKISRNLEKALADLGFEQTTPIQEKAFPIVMSGSDVVGIAQTGTGKTFAYLLPILNTLTFSKEIHPKVVILVPTRELVVQVVEETEKLAKYSGIRVLGVFGGKSMLRQKEALAQGTDVLVATPARLYDLILTKAVQLKQVKKLVIDEVDVMLDLGFRFQLINIFELLPQRRQNIMFSATMTDDIDIFIADFFKGVQKIAIAVSGTPLENIKQLGYATPNFYTKVNLLVHLLQNETEFHKVLVFVSSKRSADLLFKEMAEFFSEEICIIHSNKTQNYRLRSINQFDEGKNRILVTTDVMARGLDLQEISHVINFDTPVYPENYMHRIGRTGRAEKEGTSILLYTPAETEYKEAIETLMGQEIPLKTLPEDVEIATKLTYDEQPKHRERENPLHINEEERGASFHEKSEKNKKQNQGGSYKRIIKKKYSKPKTRGDKNYAKRKKR
ncbi:ATP-dependent RNA helicase RhlE [Maribacter sedimenticola]|uniref:ATP-dependent RNA helicase RhlE n=1 Tax=Maribacter sedimenticola TaxID=228956 RepID=A0ABY1SL41_9FLAO|nr:DEAD/DEAH box helicase [Maribacter sedimenticola]SNR70676.1 ATP-dependent RNA helicase RhlE [Maribacter sedimenticola]